MRLDDHILKASVLIVDDKPANVALLDAILKSEGYTNIQSVTDPRLVKELHDKWQFDIILLDIRMPHMSGFDVMEQLQSTVSDDYLPVLVLTAQSDAETKIRALQSGARDFVTKPFERIEVTHRIKNMLEVRLMYNRRGWEKEIVEAQVRERTQQLADTQLEFIRQLGRAGEYRDNETGMHVVRMSKGCRSLALAAGHNKEFADLILLASPMHDVGKIGIPDRVLLKPGKLEAGEWEIMKTHVDIGAEILSSDSAEIMQLARTIALTHHEKWDGSGYPNGLVGEDIPVQGRIAAICDVFDALTSDRPYKKAWAVEDAAALIREESGRHFDPVLAMKFLEILPQIIEIRNAHADEEEEDYNIYDLAAVN
tara:strand:- start:81 stop:1184 length:1104 start_codon:yes stop_codon:yes gene_type:complete